MNEPEVDSTSRMKAGMQILCALGFGFVPVVGGAQYATLFNWFIPVLLGLIFFVMWRYDVSKGLLLWLLVSAAIGDFSGHWINSRHGHPGPVLDGYGWFFVAVVILFPFLRWWDSKIAMRRSREMTPSSDQ